MCRRRLFVIVLALVGVALVTIVVTRRGRQREDESTTRAVSALEQAGAKVDREGGSLTGPVVKVRLGGKQVTDADLPVLQALTDLEEVRLQGTSVTDDGLKQLRPLRKLRVLDLRGTPVTDAGLAEIRDHHPELEELILIQSNVTPAGLRQLTVLDKLHRLEVPTRCLTPDGYRAFQELELAGQFPGIRGDEIQFPPLPVVPEHFAAWVTEIPTVRTFSIAATDVTDEVVRTLARLGKLHTIVAIGPGAVMGIIDPDALARWEDARPRSDMELTELSLGHCAITDAGLEVLPTLQNLRSVSLNDTGITDEGLKQLARCANLRVLYLHRTRISDKGLRHLAGMSRLETLELSRTPITDAGLKELQGFKNLRQLGLSSSGITDEGLIELVSLSGLRELNLANTQTTEIGRKVLGAALPDCKIESTISLAPR